MFRKKYLYFYKNLIFYFIIIANQLVGMLNSALNVSETETVLASRGASILATPPSCEATGCPSPRMHLHPQQPAISIASLQPICHSLTSQLSQLLVRFYFFHKLISIIIFKKIIFK